ncbi:MAG: sigma-70 family RNA polymerase sigma factor [Planctomycetota bacterium]|nr:sigma-70 family RNA polymerase sigma factor [Planctomycetota bacterium]
MTSLLAHLTEGDEGAADKLLPLIYGELHRMAERKMRGQSPDHTLQATALVNEAYLKLFQDGKGRVKNREHFLALAATAMRSVLVDHARTKNRQKRKATGKNVPLDNLLDSYQSRAVVDLIALDDALKKLAEFDADMARVVELRFFGGLSVKEVASVLEVSTRRVEREWTMAKAWLRGVLA